MTCWYIIIALLPYSFSLSHIIWRLALSPPAVILSLPSKETLHAQDLCLVFVPAYLYQHMITPELLIHELNGELCLYVKMQCWLSDRLTHQMLITVRWRVCHFFLRC